jgi:hypothetical protein
MKGNKPTRENSHEWNQLSIFDEAIIVKPQEPPTPVSQNHILCRNNVFYCEKNCSKFNSSTRKFDNVCEVIGEQWESEVWSPTKDYEKNPTPPSPCATCGLVKCEWCVFNSKNKEPYGCCGSCSYKVTCPDSKWKKANLNR